MTTRPGPILIAFTLALLEEMSPKKRLRVIRRVSAILGAPGVVPCGPLKDAREIEEARAYWAALVPVLIGA